LGRSSHLTVHGNTIKCKGTIDTVENHVATMEHNKKIKKTLMYGSMKMHNLFNSRFELHANMGNICQKYIKHE
jgi:hypothetical protein